MKEYFLFGMLCLVSPFSGAQNCAYMNEDPIKYYDQNTCEKRKVEKTAEIATSFTEKGFEISYLELNCVVDNRNKNT